MGINLENWKSQIKRGYLELNILMIVKLKKRIYGFDLIEELKKIDLNVKEGTLYPLLNRLASDGILHAVWETKNVSGHPRKFYTCTPVGLKTLKAMQTEFAKIWQTYRKLFDLIETEET
jgi:PadR family transcriptional regulator, regulatory protein PadR